MSQINVLHLSDLHLSHPSDWDQTTLLTALKSDFQRFTISRDAPNLIVFSGDLAKVAGTDGAYGPVFDLLMSFLDIFGLSEDKLVMCAGNHDVDRRFVGPNIPKLEGFRKEALTSSGLNKLMEKNDFKSYVYDVFKEYQNLSEMFTESSCVSRSVTSGSYFFRDLGLALITINTAMLSAGGITKSLSDQGQLAVSERVIVEALDRVPAGFKPIVVGHHPMSWLNEENQSLVERILSSRSAAYLSGHLHEVSPKQLHMMLGNFLHAQSGALYCGREYWNGYSIISMETQKNLLKLGYRRWFEYRRAFSKAEDLGDDGVFYSSPEAETYWKTTTPDLDLKIVEHWRKSHLLPYVLEKCNDSLSGVQSFEEFFVAPEFDKETPYRVEADGRMGSRVEKLSLTDMVVSKLNFVVSAQGETGKSTLLRWTALEIAKNSALETGWTAPVTIKFGMIRSYSNHIEKLVRDQLPTLPEGVSTENLLTKGLITVLVDDVDFAQKPKKDALVKFVSAFPKCRFIFASSTTFVELAALQPEIVPDVPFTRIRMRPFRKRQLQSLVANHGLTDPLKIDQMVERVIRDASSLNVPLTAVTGTFLIQIIREEPDSTVINQAALIERYIEMLLHKYAPRELVPGTFDFRNKVDLLCEISEKMTRLNDYSPDYNDVVSWAIAYLKEYGLKFSAGDLVNYFIEARIFERTNDSVRFRLRMFFEFFAATRMIESDEFKAYIFHPDRYLCFINEIGFYSALNRKDKKQLDFVFDQFLSLTK